MRAVITYVKINRCMDNIVVRYSVTWADLQSKAEEHAR
eukprot:COSAG05_NODE_690_length_7901_cov_174.242886_5_plen_38_part_00